jgi:hypothetical protein
MCARIAATMNQAIRSSAKTMVSVATTQMATRNLAGHGCSVSAGRASPASRIFAASNPKTSNATAAIRGRSHQALGRSGAK